MNKAPSVSYAVAIASPETRNIAGLLKQCFIGVKEDPVVLDLTTQSHISPLALFQQAKSVIILMTQHHNSYPMLLEQFTTLPDWASIRQKTVALTFQSHGGVKDEAYVYKPVTEIACSVFVLPFTILSSIDQHVHDPQLDKTLSDALLVARSR